MAARREREGASRRSRWTGAAVSLAVVVALVASLHLLVRATLDADGPAPAEPGTRTSGVDRDERARTSELDEPVAVARGRRADPEEVGRPPRTPSGAEPGGAVIRRSSPPNADGAPSDGGASAAEEAASAAELAARDDAAGGAAGTPARGRRGRDRADPDRGFDVRVVAAESGRPLPEAVVDVTAADGMPRRARTDHRGLASFVVPAAGTVGIEAKSPGRLRVRIDAASLPSANQPYSVELVRGVVVKGTVTDDRGPLRGATLRAFDAAALRASIPYGPDPREIEMATSDARGNYRLDCIPRGLDCTLLADAPDRTTGEIEVRGQPDVDYSVRRDVQLAAATAVEGDVRDEKGDPVPGAAVYALWPDLDARTRFHGRDEDHEELSALDVLVGVRLGEMLLPWRARTDDAGRFRVLVDEQVKEVRLIAMHPGRGRSRLAPERAPKRGGGTLTVHGRVRAEFLLLDESLRPAEGMTVRPYFPWEKWAVTGRGAGLYGVADMDEGPIAVDVLGPAGAPGTYVGRRVNAETLVWRAHLRDPATLRGIVVDDEGRRVAGAVITAEPVSTTTDEFGQFELKGVGPHTRWIDVTADGHVASGRSVDPQQSALLRVELRRESKLRLRLVLPRDRSPPAWFRVWKRSGSGWDEEVSDEFAWDDGVVELTGVAKGSKYMVFVPGCLVLTGDVGALPGTVEDLGPVQLVAAPAVADSVVDESGAPVARANVGLVLAGSEPWIHAIPEREIEAAYDGSFALDLVSGSSVFDVVVSAPGFATTPQRFSPADARRATVVIGRGRTFLGRWTDPNWRDVLVRVLGPREEVYARVRIRRDGGFDAEVPLRPHAVELVAVDRYESKVVVRAEVPASFRDGDVFLIPAAPR